MTETPKGSIPDSTTNQCAITTSGTQSAGEEERVCAEAEPVSGAQDGAAATRSGKPPLPSRDCPDSRPERPVNTTHFRLAIIASLLARSSDAAPAELVGRAYALLWESEQFLFKKRQVFLNEQKLSWASNLKNYIEDGIPFRRLIDDRLIPKSRTEGHLKSMQAVVGTVKNFYKSQITECEKLLKEPLSPGLGKAVPYELNDLKIELKRSLEAEALPPTRLAELITFQREQRRVIRSTRKGAETDSTTFSQLEAEKLAQTLAPNVKPAE